MIVIARNLLNFIKTSRTRRYLAGFVFVYLAAAIFGGGMWVIYTGLGAAQDYAERQILKNIAEAPASDYVEYKNNQVIVQDQYVVGKPMVFITDRRATGEYDLSIVDRIYCPQEPRSLVERAYSEGSTKKGHLRTDWTLGNYRRGGRFDPVFIDRPYQNCIIESTISFEVQGVQKSLVIEGDRPFDIVESADR